MRLRGSTLAAAGIVVVCAVWVGSGLIGPHDSEPASASAKAAAAAPVRVGVIDSSARPVAARLKLTGTTRANRSVEVRAETRGRVAEAMAEKGAFLPKGAPIVRLAMEDRAAHLARAESLLAQREIEYSAASRLADRDFASRVRVATTKADRDAAAAEVAAARLDIVLDTRPVEVGTLLGLDDPVATVVELDPIKVTIQVTETAISKVRPGAVTEMTFPDGQTAEGVVSYVGSVAERATRTFPVEIELANPDRAISAGMTVEVALPLGQTQAHAVSPAVLTLSGAGEVGVKTVNDAGVVEFHPAILVREDERGLWLGGLPQSLRLITVGQDFVSAGQSVETAPDTLLNPPKPS
jgi:multidrug efflux system membrane fusion protein